MAVCGIHHDHVHPGFHQRSNALVGAGPGTHCRAHTEATLGILAGIGVFGRFLDVFHGDHAAQIAGFIHHNNFLDTMLVQQCLHFVSANTFLHRHQPVLAGHDVFHTLVVVGDETRVAAGNNAHHLVTFHHRNAGNVVRISDADQFGHRGIGADSNRIFYHTGFVFFHHAHIARLVFGIHAFMEDTNAPFLRHGNGQAVLGDCIHGCGYQRNVQSDVPSQFGFQGHVLGQHIGMGRHKQNVVKR